MFSYHSDETLFSYSKKLLEVGYSALIYLLFLSESLRGQQNGWKNKQFKKSKSEGIEHHTKSY